MLVFENTLQADEQGIFFKNFVKNSAKVGEELTWKVSKNHARGLEIGAKISGAAVS